MTDPKADHQDRKLIPKIGLIRTGYDSLPVFTYRLKGLAEPGLEQDRTRQQRIFLGGWVSQSGRIERPLRDNWLSFRANFTMAGCLP